MILLDLYKDYNTLDMSRCLDVLEGYGMGTRALRLLRRYWERLKMVVRTGGYYEEPFHGGREMSPRGTHCCPPSSMWLWTRWFATGNTWWRNGRGGDTIDDNRDAEQTAGRTIQDLDNGRQRDEEGNQRLTVKAELFYTNNGMVAYTDPDWLQLEFDMMTGLFDRVGLRKNVRKNVGIV